MDQTVHQVHLNRVAGQGSRHRFGTEDGRHSLVDGIAVENPRERSGHQRSHAFIFQTGDRLLARAPAAKITPAEKRAINQTITKVYQLFGCKGYARVDMRLDKEGKVNVIEVNPNPDISPGTGAARQADAAGMTYAEFMDKIIQFAFERDLWAQPVSTL